MKIFLAFSTILMAILSYVILATQFGVYQRVPLIHYLIAVVGMAFLMRMTWMDYNHKRLVMNVLGALLCVGFLWWTLSYSEYDGKHGAQEGRVISSELADLTLRDTSGASFDLKGSLDGGKATLIVFYRGFW